MNVLLSTTPYYAAQLAVDIANWQSKRAREGWQTQIDVATETSGYAYRSRLATLSFDHLFLLGPVPQIYVTSIWDGHSADERSPAPCYLAMRNASIDNARAGTSDDCGLVLTDGLYAGVGWVNFENLAGVSDPIDQTRRYLTRRETNDFSVYPIVARLNDRFNYVSAQGDYSQIGNRIVAEFTEFPHAIYRFSNPVVNDSDGDIDAQIPAWLYIDQSGGFAFGDGQYLYDLAHYSDFITRPIQAPIVCTFGSTLWNVLSGGSIVRAALVDLPSYNGLATRGQCRAVASWYSPYGYIKWSTLINGGTLGDVAKASAVYSQVPIPLLLGDPTLRLDGGARARFAANETSTEGVMTQADRDWVSGQITTLAGTIADLTGRVAKLEQTGGGGTGKIVVLQALYQQRDNPSIATDNTAEVQTLIDSGREWDPGDNLQDAYPRIVKQEFVKYTDVDGTTKVRTLAQWEQWLSGKMVR